MFQNNVDVFFAADDKVVIYVNKPNCWWDKSVSLELFKYFVYNVFGDDLDNYASKGATHKDTVQFVIANTANAMVKKIMEYSHPQFHVQNLNKIRTILGKNSFPPREVTKIIHLATAPNTNTARSKNDQPKPKYCSLTYIPKLSEALKRQIEYFIPEVTIANRPDDKLGRIYSKQKDKLTDMQQSDVVYRIKCSICQSLYIGETCQRACTRKQQHKNSVSQTNLAKPKTASALALHTKTTGHAFDFDSMKILDRQHNKKKLQISEVNHIIMNREVACNYKRDTEHIAPAYSNILRQYASKRFPTRNAGA
ncbi:hypothetical protein HA402_004650 [Bradysia odoriphaga]|nr:hypothetical protein HA402_004650 [Bradysia odoriphaga]